MLRGSSELFSIGNLTLRLEAVLFIIGFLVARKLLLFLYRSDNMPFRVSALSIYLVISAIIGSRLFFMVVQEPELLGSKFLTIFIPFEFDPNFRLLSKGQFSLYGAVLGILLFVAYYKKRLKQTYLQVLDKITLSCALAGVFLFAISTLNSEIVGKETASSVGAVFMGPVKKGLLEIPCCIMRSPDGKNPLENVVIRNDPAFETSKTSHRPVILYLFFNTGYSEQLVNEFLVGDVKTFLYDMASYVHEPGTQPLRYRIFLERDGRYIARVSTMGIARYPVPIFEGAALLILFVSLFLLWQKSRWTDVPGRMFGLFMVCFWTLHFLFQLMKLPDESDFFGVMGTQSFFNALFILIGLVSLAFSCSRVPSLQR